MKKIAIVFTFLFTISFQLFGQWQLLNSPSATPDIQKVAYHPDGYIIAVSINSEVFRSDSNQNNWSKIATLDTIVSCLKISPQGIVYAGIKGGYVFSYDGGFTWIYKSLSPNLVRYIVDIEFNSPGYIYMIQDYYYPDDNETIPIGNYFTIQLWGANGIIDEKLYLKIYDTLL